MKRIVLISTGQPTLNPRLVKEADALVQEGYEVMVLYQHWSNWATLPDQELLKDKKWSYRLVGGNPIQHRFSYFITRLIYKWHRFISKIIGLKFGLAELSVARCSWLLALRASNIKADLYIAHNLGALPAAVFASKYNRARIGFDAEDFHRYETSDEENNIDVKRNKFLEERYIPQTNYLTAASPLIAAVYEQIFKKNTVSILNVFEPFAKTTKETKGQKIKLFWFSQTIGPKRGVEEIIKAINLSKYDFELYLLGEVNDAYRQKLTSMLSSSGTLYFLAPVAQQHLFSIATTFDIGLATEIGIPYNRDICLTNKIFTYIQAGLATIATDTTAQADLMNQHEKIGFNFRQGDVHQLASLLNLYHENRTLLFEHQQQAYLLGQNTFNWTIESKKFLKVIHQTLSN